ncbi:MAG: alpha/beta hydrolase [Thermomicrobiales bacterium]
MTNGPVDRDLQINGIRLRVAIWGELSDPSRAVLLAHGLTANSRSWALLGPALAEAGLCAIALDLRGRGRSDKPASGYGIPFHANDLLAVSRELGLDRPHVIGHSLGARIGIWLAALYPQSLGKLVLVDAGATLPPDTFQAISPALARLGAVYPSREAYLDQVMNPAMRDSPIWRAYYDYDAEEAADGTVRSSVPKSAIDEENGVNFFRTQLDALPAYIKAPTLIARATIGLLGADAGQLLPMAEAERMQSMMADARSCFDPGVESLHRHRHQRRIRPRNGRFSARLARDRSGEREASFRGDGEEAVPAGERSGE